MTLYDVVTVEMLDYSSKNCRT